MLGQPSSMVNRLLPCVWLLFLLLPLFAMWGRQGNTVGHDVAVTAVVVAFSALFVYSSAVAYEQRKRWTRLHDIVVVCVMLATPLILVAYDSSGYWSYALVYALLPAMRLWDQSAQYRSVLILGLLTALAAFAGGLRGSELIIPVGVVLGSGAGWLGFGRLIAANAALEGAQEEKARVAVAEERLRFARDLHDLLGHSLSVITLKSELAGRLMTVDAARATTEVTEIEQVARRALKEVREAASGYRQATLAVELAGSRTALAAAHISWAEEVDPDLSLPQPVEAVLAWTVREGVTNVIRHSHAATCTLALDVDDTTATMTIADDGTGAVNKNAATNGSAGEGNGLRGLGERVAAASGILEAGPPEGGGYRLMVSVPVGVDHRVPLHAAPPPPPASGATASGATATGATASGDLRALGVGPIGRMLGAARGPRAG